MLYITTTGAKTVADSCAGILITVNTALTGTLTVTDGGTTVAVITNPTVGSFYRYYGFKGAAAVNSSATCDVTASALSQVF